MDMIIGRESRQPRPFIKPTSSQGGSPPLHVPFRKAGQVVPHQQGGGANIGAGNRLHVPFISNASPSPSVLMNELVRLLPDIPTEKSGNNSHVCFFDIEFTNSSLFLGTCPKCAKNENDEKSVSARLRAALFNLSARITKNSG